MVITGWRTVAWLKDKNSAILVFLSRHHKTELIHTGKDNCVDFKSETPECKLQLSHPTTWHWTNYLMSASIQFPHLKNGIATSTPVGCCKA